MVSAFELGQTTQPLEQVKYMTPGAMEQEGLENIKLPWSSVVLPAIWDNTETSGDILKGGDNISSLNAQARENKEQRLSLEELKAKYPNVNFTAPTYASTAEYMAQRQTRQQNLEWIKEHSTVRAPGAMFIPEVLSYMGKSFTDPVELGIMGATALLTAGTSALVPSLTKFTGAGLAHKFAGMAIPENYIMAEMATANLPLSARVAGRFSAGFVENALGNLAIEPWIAASSRKLGDDYTAMNSAMNVFVGGLMGGTFHVAGGLMADPFTRMNAQTKLKAAADYIALREAGGDGLAAVAQNIMPQTTLAARDVIGNRGIKVTKLKNGQFRAHFNAEQGLLKHYEGIIGRTPADAIRNLQYTYATVMRDPVLFGQLNSLYGSKTPAKVGLRELNPFAGPDKVSQIKNANTVTKGGKKFKLNFDSPVDKMFYNIQKILNNPKNKGKAFNDLAAHKDTLMGYVNWITENIGDTTEADIKKQARGMYNAVHQQIKENLNAGSDSTDIRINSFIRQTDLDVQPEFLSPEAWADRLQKQKEVLLGQDKEAAFNLLSDLYQLDKQVQEARLEQLKTARTDIQKLINVTDEQLHKFTKRDLARKNVVDTIREITPEITDEQLTSYLYMLDVVTGDFAKWLEDNKIEFVSTKDFQSKVEKRLNQLVGYHGSAASFTEFDLTYAYTGEGAAAHGYGIYIAKNKDIAQKYADKLATQDIAGNIYTVKVPDKKYLLKEQKSIGVGDQSKYVCKIIWDYITQHKAEFDKMVGHYASAIHRLTGRDFYDIVGRIETNDAFNPDNTIRKQAASKKLNALGIYGIQYTGKADGEAYVIFSPKKAKIQDVALLNNQLQQAVFSPISDLRERFFRSTDLDRLKYFKSSQETIAQNSITTFDGSITNEDMDVLMHVKTGKYHMQDMLYENTPELGGYSVEQSLNDIIVLDRLISNGHFKEDSVLYRGIPQEGATRLDLGNVKKDMTIQAPGYLSTSIFERQARLFAETSAKSDTQYVLKVKMPKGSTGLDVESVIAENIRHSKYKDILNAETEDEITDLSTKNLTMEELDMAAFAVSAIEGEVILPKDLALKVLDVQDDGWQRVITVTPDATLNNIYGSNLLRDNVDILFNKAKEKSQILSQLEGLAPDSPEYTQLASEAFYNGVALPQEIINNIPDLRVAQELTEDIPASWLFQAAQKPSLANRIIGEFTKDITLKDFTNLYGNSFVYALGNGRYTRYPDLAIRETGRAVLYDLGEGFKYRVDFEGPMASMTPIIEEVLRWEPAFKGFLSRGPEEQLLFVKKLFSDAMNLRNKNGETFVQHIDKMNLTGRGKKVKKQTEFFRIDVNAGEIIYPLENQPNKPKQLGELSLFKGMTPEQAIDISPETVYKALIKDELNKVENLQSDYLKLKKAQREAKAKINDSPSSTSNELVKQVQTQEKQIKNAKKKIDLAKKVRESKLEKINKQAETYNQIIKGAVDVETEGRYIVGLFQNADISTLVHETAHIFRRTVLDTEMLAQAEHALGIKDGKWTREAEEKFATAFEKYLAEGKAPAAGLEGLFEQFKSWLTNIYIKLSQSPMDEDFSPEIRKVFDELFAEERVKMAEQAGFKNEDISKSLYQNALGQHKEHLVHINSTIKDIESMLKQDVTPDSTVFERMKTEKLERIQSKLDMLSVQQELTPDEIRDKMNEVSTTLRQAENEYGKIADNQILKNKTIQDNPLEFYENELILDSQSLQTYAKTLGLTEDQIDRLLDEGDPMAPDLMMSTLNQEAEANNIMEGALKEFGNCARGEL